MSSLREQERREEKQRIRSEAGGILDPLDDEGSFDDGDPYTTNLYIGEEYTQASACTCDLHVVTAAGHRVTMLACALCVTM